MYQVENKYGINSIIIPICYGTITEFSDITNRYEYKSIGVSERLSLDSLNKFNKETHYFCKSLNVSLDNWNNSVVICISYKENFKKIERPLLNSFPYKKIISDLKTIGMVFNEELLALWIRANIIKFIKNDKSVYFSEYTKVDHDFSTKIPVSFMYHINHNPEFQILNVNTSIPLVNYIKDNFDNSIKPTNTIGHKIYKLFVPVELFGNYLDTYIKYLTKHELSDIPNDIILKNYINNMLVIRK